MGSYSVQRSNNCLVVPQGHVELQVMVASPLSRGTLEMQIPVSVWQSEEILTRNRRVEVSAEALQDKLTDHVFKDRANHAVFGGYRLWAIA